MFQYFIWTNESFNCGKMTTYIKKKKKKMEDSSADEASLLQDINALFVTRMEKSAR